ncbi:NYN domain-containing protein [Paludibaculum fermentans]|uniref:NYN domain-containing protein n=1 Tax=Paludibaculum fermentans TaxID=1473598 RepID=UPI003EB81313
MPTRVISYIDGFNLYFGIRDAKLRRYLWLDLPKLSTSLLLDGQMLQKTKYFTSRISSPVEKRERQSTYIDALSLHAGAALGLYYGKYQTQARECQSCHRVDMVPSEKKTDVNIAVEMMVDAFQDAFDTAILITADSDLVPPVSAIRRLFPTKRIIAAFPPNRRSEELAQVVHGHFPLGRQKLASAQLPEQITQLNGRVLARPSKWV